MIAGGALGHHREAIVETQRVVGADPTAIPAADAALWVDEDRAGGGFAPDGQGRALAHARSFFTVVAGQREMEGGNAGTALFVEGYHLAPAPAPSELVFSGAGQLTRVAPGATIDIEEEPPREDALLPTHSGTFLPAHSGTFSTSTRFSWKAAP